MRKRVLALVVSCLMGISLVSCGQAETSDGKVTIGICQSTRHEALDEATQGFKEALKEQLGDTVEFLEQNGQGDPNTCAAIVNDFVAHEVDLILANSTAALQSAAVGTGQIPILGTSITDYGVALELDEFDGVVGGNISGTCDIAPLDQQAQMVKDLFPEAKNVAMIYCSSEANSKYQADILEAEFKNIGYDCKVYTFTDAYDLSAVCEIASDEADVIFIPTDNTAAANAGIIENICRSKKVPIVAGEDNICVGCGIATLTIDYYELGFATGQMAARVLEGEDISSMPIEFAPSATKKYMADRCEELGIVIPDDYEAIE